MAKNFTKKIVSGNNLDKARRAANQTTAASVDARFDAVSEALDGRTSLLDPAEKKAAGEGAASFHVETLVREGKATSRYTCLPIALIDDNPLNSRTFYNEDKIRERAASIATHGQMVPALVAPSATQEGRFTLIDGQYRKRANMHLANTEMNVCVLEGLSPVDFYKLARTLNSEREQESVLDVAFGYRKLMDEGLARTEEQLGQIVGDSKARVNKLLALTTLPQPVLDVIAENPDSFGVATCYELTLYTRVAGEDKGAELAERIVRDSLPVLKVEAIRKKAQEGTKGTRQTSRQYKLVRDGIELGTLKEWDTGRVTLDVTVEDASKREALVASFKAQLGVDEGV